MRRRLILAALGAALAACDPPAPEPILDDGPLAARCARQDARPIGAEQGPVTVTR